MLLNQLICIIQTEREKKNLADRNMGIMAYIDSLINEHPDGCCLSEMQPLKDYITRILQKANVCEEELRTQTTNHHNQLDALRVDNELNTANLQQELGHVI